MMLFVWWWKHVVFFLLNALLITKPWHDIRDFFFLNSLTRFLIFSFFGVPLVSLLCLTVSKDSTSRTRLIACFSIMSHLSVANKNCRRRTGSDLWYTCWYMWWMVNKHGTLFPKKKICAVVSGRWQIISLSRLNTAMKDSDCSCQYGHIYCSFTFFIPLSVPWVLLMWMSVMHKGWEDVVHWAGLRVSPCFQSSCCQLIYIQPTNLNMNSWTAALFRSPLYTNSGQKKKKKRLFKGHVQILLNKIFSGKWIFSWMKMRDVFGLLQYETFRNILRKEEKQC